MVERSPLLAVTFYTKAGCHLCDEVRDMLEELAEEHEFALTEIDIRRDLALFEEYRYRIPVLKFNGETQLEGRIEAEELALFFAGQKGE